MARFFSYEEIEKGLITTKESVCELASAIMELDHFKSGKAVVFGSVAWGENTWRSDIDIADFSGMVGEPPRVSSILGEFFRERYGDDVGFMVEHHIIELLSNQKTKGSQYFLPEISPSTRDHFRLLAEAKKGPYQTFYLKLSSIKFRKRSTDITEYCSTILGIWANRRYYCKGRRLNWNEFGALQSLENFPKQLMRKVLGEKGKLPMPDTVSNIQREFESIDDPTFQRISRSFRPFFEIGEKYRDIVISMQNGKTYSELEYSEAVGGLFQELPVEAIVTDTLAMYNGS